MISCGDYDYIEIACMYRYTVELTLTSGNVIEGVAMDTARNDNRNECVILDVDSSKVLVELNEVKSLKVLTNNAQFTEVEFTDS